MQTFFWKTLNTSVHIFNEVKRKWLSSHNFSFLSRKNLFSWMDFRCKFFWKCHFYLLLSLVFPCIVNKNSTLHENHVKRYFVFFKKENLTRYYRPYFWLKETCTSVWQNIINTMLLLKIFKFPSIDTFFRLSRI